MRIQVWYLVCNLGDGDVSVRFYKSYEEALEAYNEAAETFDPPPWEPNFKHIDVEDYERVY